MNWGGVRPADKSRVWGDVFLKTKESCNMINVVIDSTARAVPIMAIFQVTSNAFKKYVIFYAADPVNRRVPVSCTVSVHVSNFIA